MNDLCAAIGHAYGNYYKQLPRIRVKGRHIDLMSEHYAIEIIKNPRNQGVSRFQSGEELVNSVGK